MCHAPAGGAGRASVSSSHWRDGEGGWRPSGPERLRDGPRRRKRFRNGDIHVDVAIGGKPPDEAHAEARTGLGEVAQDQRLVAGETQRVIGNIVRPALATGLAHIDRRGMALPGREVFVLGDARPGHREIAVVYLRDVLEGAGCPERLEIERAVGEAARSVAEPGVDRAGVDRVQEL